MVFHTLNGDSILKQGTCSVAYGYVIRHISYCTNYIILYIYIIYIIFINDFIKDYIIMYLQNIVLSNLKLLSYVWLESGCRSVPNVKWSVRFCAQGIGSIRDPVNHNTAPVKQKVLFSKHQTKECYSQQMKECEDEKWDLILPSECEFAETHTAPFTLQSVSWKSQRGACSPSTRRLHLHLSLDDLLRLPWRSV